MLNGDHPETSKETNKTIIYSEIHVFFLKLPFADITYKGLFFIDSETISDHLEIIHVVLSIVGPTIFAPSGPLIVKVMMQLCEHMSTPFSFTFKVSPISHDELSLPNDWITRQSPSVVVVEQTWEMLSRVIVILSSEKSMSEPPFSSSVILNRISDDDSEFSKSLESSKE